MVQLKGSGAAAATAASCCRRKSAMASAQGRGSWRWLLAPQLPGQALQLRHKPAGLTLHLSVPEATTAGGGGGGDDGHRQEGGRRQGQARHQLHH